MSKKQKLLLPIGFLCTYIGVGMLMVWLFEDSVTGTGFTDFWFAILAFLVIWMTADEADVRQTPLGGWFPICLFGSVLVIWFITSVTGTWINLLFADTAYEVADLSGVPQMQYLLLSLFLAPVAEELLMRGLFFRFYNQVLPRWAAYGISALLFAVLHGTAAHLYLGLVCGVLFAAIYEYTGNILWPVVAHVLYNCMAVIGAGASLPAWLFSYGWMLFFNVMVGMLLIAWLSVAKNEAVRLVVLPEREEEQDV